MPATSTLIKPLNRDPTAVSEFPTLGREEAYRTNKSKFGEMISITA